MAFPVDSYYRLTNAVIPEVEQVGEQIRRDQADDLYPFLWDLLSPLMLNVGMHGAPRRREQVFDLADELINRYPEIANEIGVAIVEVAPDGWFEFAKAHAGPTLRSHLNAWEPGWENRQGPRTRRPDEYGVEKALKLGN